ncbi:MAG: imidazolonepropionase [Acidobacteria bacterium]|nr:MAG: imidazolonepropionase [Acidobacteriota bacterium]
MKVDLIVTDIGQLVTCASPDGPKRGRAMTDAGIIDNGAVAINGGKFVAVGSSDEIARDHQSENIIDARGRVVCPGFVDPHTHIVFAGERLDEFELKIKGADYLEILSNGGGIISTVQKTREELADFLVADGNMRIEKMGACGTTTIEVKTGYGLDLESELKMLRVIFEMDKMRSHSCTLVPTVLAAHAVPPEFRGRTDDYVDLICEQILPQAKKYYDDFTHFPGCGIPIFADVFCEKNAFDLRQSRRVLETAKNLGYGIKAHVDEFTNLGGSRMAIEMGATSIDHLDAISDREIEMLANSETVGVITPTVNFNFGSPEFADARKMIDAGCAIALSTDFNPGSAPCPSQPMVMAIACRYQKLLPAEAMNAATINAAHAIGLGERFGSIEIGKEADLVFLDAADYREVCYEFGGTLVSKVVKGGREVYNKNDGNYPRRRESNV